MSSMFERRFARRLTPTRGRGSRFDLNPSQRGKGASTLYEALTARGSRPLAFSVNSRVSNKLYAGHEPRGCRLFLHSIVLTIAGSTGQRGIYSSPTASLVLTDSSQLTSDSQHLVEAQERQRSPQVGQHEIQRELLGLPKVPPQLHQVEKYDRPSNDDGLAHLQPVDARQDVDSVGAEHRQHTHVQIVQEPWRDNTGHWGHSEKDPSTDLTNALTEIDREPDPRPERFGDDDAGGVEVDVVHHEQWQRSDVKLIMGSSKKHKESKKRKHHSKSRSPEKIKEKHRHHKKHHKEKKRDKLKDKTAEFASKYVDYESEVILGTPQVRADTKYKTVIPIHKPGKPPGYPTSYRPISLLSCVKAYMSVRRVGLLSEVSERASEIKLSKFSPLRFQVSHVART
uniref:(California timema) hypothetical protein n=1 Tax=Timema californicum TaxID=61474 RepID=A0A7R9J797_TIMCA|nr:unnamed protein product [Timema californicum]